jgi:hypothetical protein
MYVLYVNEELNLSGLGTVGGHTARFQATKLSETHPKEIALSSFILSVRKIR